MGLGKDDRYLVLVCIVALLDPRVVEARIWYLVLVCLSSDSPHLRVVEASIAGQSTFGMAGTKGEKMEKLQIVEAASALR